MCCTLTKNLKKLSSGISIQVIFTRHYNIFIQVSRKVICIFCKNSIKHANTLSSPESMIVVVLANKSLDRLAGNNQLTIFRIISVTQSESRRPLKNSVFPNYKIIIVQSIGPTGRYFKRFFNSQGFIVIMDVILLCFPTCKYIFEFWVGLLQYHSIINLIFIHVKMIAIKINNSIQMNPGEDLKYHAETHLSDILK